MNFCTKDLRDEEKKYFVIKNEENILRKLKEKKGKFDSVEIDFDSLNLGKKIYGNSIKETKIIQKQNTKIVIKFYKFCKKVVSYLKRKNIEFDGIFYIRNLEKKKNNNDFMVCKMLDVHFNVSLFKKFSASYIYACDYLDLENEQNKMCNFVDNECTKHRKQGVCKPTGCCPSFCKYRSQGSCSFKNLSCKLFMCTYLEERGYIFLTGSIAILRNYFTFFERFLLYGLICRTTKKALIQLRLIRFLEIFIVLLVLYVILFLIV